MQITAEHPASTALVHRPARPSYAELTKWQRYEEFFPERMRSGPESTPSEEWWSWNGIDVHLDRLAVPDAKLKVIVLHGAGAYGRVMSPAAVIARQHGYETVSPDLPGYGLTSVPWNRFTYPEWVECVSALIDAEIERDGRPVMLFGVSLGGCLAYHVAARNRKVVGLVATTLADPREDAVREGFSRNAWLARLGLPVLGALSAVTDGLPLPMRFMSKMNRISNRPELSALCSTDRLGGGNWVPARFLRSFVQTSPDLEPEAFDVCPVLLVHPGVDRMTEISLSQRFFDRLAAPKRMVVLEGASHMPTESPGIDQLEAAVVEFAAELARAVH